MYTIISKIMSSKTMNMCLVNIFLLVTLSLLSHGKNLNSEKCIIRLENYTYEINVVKNTKGEQSGLKNFLSFQPEVSKHENIHERLKRSTNDGNREGLEQEVFRLKRKIGRMERKLSQSFSQLSRDVSQGLRRMEDKIDSGQSGHSKREIRHFSSQNPCPAGFHTVDADKLQTCYLMSNFNTTWYEANEYCIALGSNLVALDTVQEHYVLTYLIKNHQGHSKAEGWWTSGAFVSKTKQWMWATDVSITKPFTFIRWAPNQPNDDTSNCVFLRRDDDQLWNDEICSAKFNFVCETCFGCGSHRL